MFDDVLIESAGKDKTEGRGVTAVISAIVHIIIIGAIVAAGYYVKKNPHISYKLVARRRLSRHFAGTYPAELPNLPQALSHAHHCCIY